MDYATTTFVGRLTQPIDIKTTNGNTIGKSSIAINKPKKTNEASFFNLTFFNKTAELAGEYLTKGDRVFVEATPEQQKYTDKNGNQVATISFLVKNFISLERRGE